MSIYCTVNVSPIWASTEQEFLSDARRPLRLAYNLKCGEKLLEMGLLISRSHASGR